LPRDVERHLPDEPRRKPAQQGRERRAVGVAAAGLFVLLIALLVGGALIAMLVPGLR